MLPSFYPVISHGFVETASADFACVVYNDKGFLINRLYEFFKRCRLPYGERSEQYGFTVVIVRSGICIIDGRSFVQVVCYIIANFTLILRRGYHRAVFGEIYTVNHIIYKQYLCDKTNQ